VSAQRSAGGRRPDTTEQLRARILRAVRQPALYAPSSAQLRLAEFRDLGRVNPPMRRALSRAEREDAER
jgi:hypothetical protein